MKAISRPHTIQGGDLVDKRGTDDSTINSGTATQTKIMKPAELLNTQGSDYQESTSSRPNIIVDKKGFLKFEPDTSRMIPESVRKKQARTAAHGKRHVEIGSYKFTSEEPSQVLKPALRASSNFKT